MEDVIEKLREYSDDLAMEDRIDESLFIDEAVLKLENSLGNREAIMRGSRREPSKYPPRIVLVDAVREIKTTLGKMGFAFSKMEPPARLMSNFHAVVKGVDLDVERPADADKQRDNNKKLALEIDRAVEFIETQILADESKKVARGAKALSSRYRKLTKNMIRAGELPIRHEVEKVIDEVARAAIAPLIDFIENKRGGYFEFTRSLYEVGLTNRASVDHEARALWIQSRIRDAEERRHRRREAGETVTSDLDRYRAGYDHKAASTSHDPRKPVDAGPYVPSSIPIPPDVDFESFSAFDLGWELSKGSKESND